MKSIWGVRGYTEYVLIINYAMVRIKICDEGVSVDWTAQIFAQNDKVRVVRVLRFVSYF